MGRPEGHTAVNLTKRVQTDAGLQFCPVVFAANGRVSDRVMVDASKDTAHEERHTEGFYYIEWRESGQRRRLSVGTSPQDALARKLAKEAEIRARRHGLKVESPESNSGKRGVAVAAAAYLLTKGREKPKTRAKYRVGLEYFQEHCTKRYLEDITREDVLSFIEFLRTVKKLSMRTTHDTIVNLVSFLKAHDIKVTKKRDIPKFVEKDVEIYEQGELDALFAACSEEERLWYEFFLMSGMRELEVVHCFWRDVNFTAKTIRVSAKAEYGWTSKNYKSREIPVPDVLIEKLRERKKQADTKCPLIFPTSGCNPKRDFLDCLKAVAKRAGLDPDNCYLHKFRATFATRHLWNRVDIRTVQSWMGHNDLESTTRYLCPQRGEKVRAMVNSTF